MSLFEPPPRGSGVAEWDITTHLLLAPYNQMYALLALNLSKLLLLKNQLGPEFWRADGAIRINLGQRCNGPEPTGISICRRKFFSLERVSESSRRPYHVVLLVLSIELFGVLQAVTGWCLVYMEARFFQGSLKDTLNHDLTPLLAHLFVGDTRWRDAFSLRLSSFLRDGEMELMLLEMEVKQQGATLGSGFGSRVLTLVLLFLNICFMAVCDISSKYVFDHTVCSEGAVIASIEIVLYLLRPGIHYSWIWSWYMYAIGAESFDMIDFQQVSFFVQQTFTGGGSWGFGSFYLDLVPVPFVL
ncbi:hypothetical protein Tco_0138294 [Tanacetum coccineum]